MKRKINLPRIKLDKNGKKNLISKCSVIETNEVIIIIKEGACNEAFVKKLNLALQLVSCPIHIPRAHRKEFMKGMTHICRMMNKQDKKIVSMHRLAGWVWTGFQLSKTSDNQHGISEESIETELYALIREKEAEIPNCPDGKKSVPLAKNQKQVK